MIDAGLKIKFTEFLRSKVVGVISTVSSDDKPESATIYFDTDENFNFYFMTKGFTRKNENLQKNQEVALVVGADNDPVTVQVQGRAQKIEDGLEFRKALDMLKKRFFDNSYVAPLFQLASEKNEVVLYKITPSWIRWLDLREPNQNGNFIQIIP